MKRLTALIPLAILCCGFSCKAPIPPPPPPPTQHIVSLRWVGNSLAKTYMIYRGSVCGSYIPIGSSSITSYQDRAVVAGDHYCYVVTDLDAHGTESAQSNAEEVTITTP